VHEAKELQRRLVSVGEQSLICLEDFEAISSRLDSDTLDKLKSGRGESMVEQWLKELAKGDMILCVKKIDMWKLLRTVVLDIQVRG